MKPNLLVRKAKGYCCVMCDGPYATWKKKTKRKAKRKDKELCKRQVKKETNETLR